MVFQLKTPGMIARMLLWTSILTILFSCSQAQGVSFFEGSYPDAQAEALRSQKPLFVFCYASWNTNSNRMLKQVFTQKEVGDFFNGNYVCLKMDMEKDEGSQLARRWRIRAYPTYLFFHSVGDKVDRAMGEKDANSLLTLAREMLPKK
jgi:thiol:disulfide interchange protein